MESLGQRISRFRKALKLSQAKLAERVGVTQGLVSQWEMDAVNIPTGQLPLIAKALQVAETDLVSSTAVEPEQTDELMRLEAIRLVLGARREVLEGVLIVLRRKVGGDDGAAAIKDFEPGTG